MQARTALSSPPPQETPEELHYLGLAGPRVLFYLRDCTLGLPPLPRHQVVYGERGAYAFRLAVQLRRWGRAHGLRLTLQDEVLLAYYILTESFIPDGLVLQESRMRALTRASAIMLALRPRVLKVAGLLRAPFPANYVQLSGAEARRRAHHRDGREVWLRHGLLEVAARTYGRLLREFNLAVTDAGSDRQLLLNSYVADAKDEDQPDWSGDKLQRVLGSLRRRGYDMAALGLSGGVGGESEESGRQTLRGMMAEYAGDLGNRVRAERPRKPLPKLAMVKTATGYRWTTRSLREVVRRSARSQGARRTVPFGREVPSDDLRAALDASEARRVLEAILAERLRLPTRPNARALRTVREHLDALLSGELKQRELARKSGCSEGRISAAHEAERRALQQDPRLGNLVA